MSPHQHLPLAKELYESGVLFDLALHGVIPDDPPTFDQLPEHVQNECCSVAEYILEREAALHDKLEIAENGIVSLRDTLAENEQLQKVAEAAITYRKTTVLNADDLELAALAILEAGAALWDALDAWQKGRTP